MSDAPEVVRLRVEHLADPMVDRAVPRLSWQVRSARAGARQAAYQILVARSAETVAAGVGDVWDSERVPSPDCVLVPYGGPPLASRQQVHWTVRVWDDEGNPSPFAPAARWEMGLLEQHEWDAVWIAAPAGRQPTEVSYLRTTLAVPAPVVRARAYVTALGLYQLRVNGQAVGSDRFTPGWTDYTARLHYQVFDLTDALVAGDNTVDVLLAEGWYAGYVGFTGARELYGDTPQLLVRVEIDTEDGRVVHTSGPDWVAGRGPVGTSDMLMGESQDLTRAVAGWAPVRMTAGTTAPLSISPAPPVRVLGELRPLAVTRVGPADHRVDLGQNISGWLRLRLRGDAGTNVEVRHAEVANADGSLYVDNLRSAEATDRYVLSGGADVCEPVFTFHGFRYAQVTGYEGDLDVDDVTGVVVGTAVEPVGEFTCSDERVNQLHRNIVWGARGNFLEVPTDCPQRDERLGWMGDAQVFVSTACELFDVAAFFTKWLRDVVDAQSEAGGFSNVAPRVVDMQDGVPGWGDAGVIVPWVVAGHYGDLELLDACYPAMRAWVSFVHGANPGLLWLERRSHDLGDWLNVESETDKDLIATAFFAHSTRLTARAADALGRDDEAAELHGLADAIAAAFADAFVCGDGSLKSDTQTAYALALRFGLVPDDQVTAAVDHLVAEVERRGTHVSTGFLGVNHLLPALTDGGRSDVAYALLHQDTFPSWLYAVDAGATTIWERWDGWTAERGFQDPAMNSFNHYAFGAVGEWLYQTVAGIGREPFEPARLRVEPHVGQTLDWVRASTMTPLGPVAVAWARGATGEITLTVDVPVGATAAVRVPGGDDDIEVGSGRHHFTGGSS